MRPAILLIILFLGSSVSASAIPGERLVLNTGDISPLHYKNQTGFIDVLLKEAFERLDIEVIVVKLPAERAIFNANAGIDDGDTDRVAGLEKVYPNLIPVPEAVTEWIFVAFAKDEGIPITGWDSFGPYSVGIVTGWKIFEHNVTTFTMLIKAKRERQLFMMLVNDRVDVVLFEQWQGLGLIRQHGLQGIKLLQPPLARKDMFLYLHKKHKRLVPKIAAVFRDMKADGTYQRIHDRILQPYLSLLD